MGRFSFFPAPRGATVTGAAVEAALGYTPENIDNKGEANGYAELDSNAKLPVNQLPPGPFIYKGTWNATTNTPTLVNGTGTAGDWYKVSVGGTRNLGGGSVTYDVGDDVIYNGATWDKVDNTDLVSSVAGKTGIISLDERDFSLQGSTINANTTGTFNIDLSLGRHFKLIVTDAAIVAFTNIPSGIVELSLYVTATATFVFGGGGNFNALGGSLDIVSFGGGMTSGGPVIMKMYTFDGGVNWYYGVIAYGPLGHAGTHKAGGTDAVVSNGALGTSTTTAPTQNAVKTYVDGKVEDAITDTHTTIAPSGNAVFDALALKNDKIVLAVGTFANDFTKTTTPTEDLTGASGTVAADVGDILEITAMWQVVSNGSSNGVGFNFRTGGVDYSLGKIITLNGTPQWFSATEHYTVQSGDISGGNVTIQGRIGMDNTNSTTIKGRNNVNNHFSVKNLQH